VPGANCFRPFRSGLHRAQGPSQSGRPDITPSQAAFASSGRGIRFPGASAPDRRERWTSKIAPAPVSAAARSFESISYFAVRRIGNSMAVECSVVHSRYRGGEQ
jgi:hypothetical protein